MPTLPVMVGWNHACSPKAHGSLLPVSLLSVTRLGAVPALATAMAGLAMTLFSATALEWLLRDIDVDLPLLSESVVVARLTALLELTAGGGG
jgi:hypothetical protein